MVHRLFLGLYLLLAVGLAGAAVRAADPPSDADGATIRAVIEGQIAAFRRDDGEAAFAFAAPAIRRQFGTVETFMDMVRGGYRAVYQPQTYRFGTLQLVDDLVVQKVHVVGPDGRAVTALYIMEKQPDGSWRIAGCALAAPEDQSA